MKKGFTFIDVLVGISLMLIVFLGIFGSFELGMKVISLSRSKIVATSIGNQKLEQIRNLPYESIGTKSGFPEGILEANETITRNGIDYQVSTRVDYVVDAVDGIAPPEDECPSDYKKVEVKVSWYGKFSGEISFLTDIAPKNLSQECAEKGGILSVSVFDAFGIMIPSPLIEIKNPQTNETLKSASPIDGKHYFSLATSTYKVMVSKGGYSSEQTFAAGDIFEGKTIATPEKPHPLVFEGQVTEISFSIDKLSSFSIDTLSSWQTNFFSDSFLNESKISEKANLTIEGGKVNLATSGQEYLSSGYLISTAISPTDLVGWTEFSFTDEEPAGTDLNYQLYYASGTQWLLIPDSDLPANSSGLDLSPVNLTGLNKTIYSQLKIRANFSTLSTSTSPTLYDWQISWKTRTPILIPNIGFSLKGQKIVGYDASDTPIQKYSTTSNSNSGGNINIDNLEWDSYTFASNETDLHLVNTNPSPQPINLSPNASTSVSLYFEAENSLLVTVQNLESLEPIFSASTTLSNSGLGYEKNLYSNEKGQVYFVPLEPTSYALKIEAPGYQSTSTILSVNGDTSKTIKLEQID